MFKKKNLSAEVDAEQADEPKTKTKKRPSARYRKDIRRDIIAAKEAGLPLEALKQELAEA